MQLHQSVSKIFAVAALVCLTTASQGQTTAGAGTVVVIPLIANIPSAYATRVTVRNLEPTSITLKVTYYRSNSASLGAGTTPCSNLVVPAVSGTSNGIKSFDLASQCGLGVSDDFGMMFLEDSAFPKTNLFTAYSRTQLSNGVGFSVEGYPAGNFSAASADAIGLQSTASGSNKSNCFVGALGEPVDYLLRLWNPDGTPFGSPITGFLNAYQTVRHMNVVSGDKADMRASFTVTGGASSSPNAAMIAFCTVETDVGSSGSADFRVAKSVDARDARQQRVSCYGQDDCGNASVNSAAIVSDATKRNIHYVIFDQPDFIQCALVGTGTAALEMRLRQPGDILASAQFPAVAPYFSGGHGSTSFYIDTGPRSTIGAGYTTRWYIDVQSTAGATLPIPYGITCTSGNGTSVPWIGTTAARF